MYFITLELTDKKSDATKFMAAHKDWINQGFADGAFLMVGSMKPQGGGAILASGETSEEVASRIAADPFVQQGIVKPQIQEIAPTRTDERLSRLIEAAP